MIFDFFEDFRIVPRRPVPGFPDFPQPPIDTRGPPIDTILPQPVPPPQAPPPAPAPSSPRPPPQFPTGPAANDPIFRRALGRILARAGGWVVLGAEVFGAVINREQQRRIDEAIRILEEELQRQRQKRADAQAPREVEIPDDATTPRPNLPPQEPIITVPRPQPVPVPTRVPLPGIPTPPLPLPDFPGFPDIVVVPSIPRPTVPRPVIVPQPGTVPVSNPVQPLTPGIRPFNPLAPQPLPGATPAATPRFVPTGDPVPLTPSNPTLVPSPTFTPNISANALPGLNFAACPQPAQRRCKEDKTPRDQCFKKLVKEGLTPDLDESFNWTEIDCLTGREI